MAQERGKISHGRALGQPLLIIALVSTAPFAEFYVRNLGNYISLPPLAGYAALTAGGFCVLYLLVHLLVRPETDRAVTVISVFAFVFFKYDAASGWLDGLGASHTLQALGWCAITLTSLVLAYSLGASRAAQPIQRVLVITLYLPIAFAAVAYSPPPAGPGLPIEEAFRLKGNQVWSGVPERTPNIYWIILDSYPGKKILKRQYHYDNTKFLIELRSRGYFIASNSFANYSNTLLSVSSTLDMDYLFGPDDRFSITEGGVRSALAGRANRDPVQTISGDNRTVGFLKQIGYRYIHFEARTYRATLCRGYEDECISGMPTRLSDMESVLLSRTPYQMAYLFSGSLPAPTKPVRMGDRSRSGTGIPELAMGISNLDYEKPFFLYAHIFSPHSPYSNDERCDRLEGRAIYDSPPHFVKQLQCVNIQLLALTDQIARKDPNAIVIVSSDHGPRYSARGILLAELGVRQIREYLSILNAIRLRVSCQNDLPPDLSPINTMRVVFACLGMQAPRLLEPRHFIAFGIPHRRGYGEIREVTPLLRTKKAGTRPKNHSGSE